MATKKALSREARAEKAKAMAAELTSEAPAREPYQPTERGWESFSNRIERQVPYAKRARSYLAGSVEYWTGQLDYTNPDVQPGNFDAVLSIIEHLGAAHAEADAIVQRLESVTKTAYLDGSLDL
jgi:hypothetical protein